MNLTSLVSILKGGNVALGSKLENLLSENCHIIEYTDDSVLFTKDDKLVLATFNHNLTEGKMTSANIIDNTVLSVSATDTTKKLKNQLHSVVANVVTEDFVSAQENLSAFCESFYSFSVLRNKFSTLFQEQLETKKKPSLGSKFRNKAMAALPAFKRDLFTATTVLESFDHTESFTKYTDLVEEHGIVFALGREKLKSVIAEALLYNENLIEASLKTLYEIANTFPESNEDLDTMTNSNYDIEAGMAPEETPEDLEVDELAKDFPAEEESVEDFQSFDPSELSEEDKQNLHREVLKNVLQALETFVMEKASNVEEVDIPADLGEKIKADLESLEDPTISAELLSSIEGRWEPMLSFLLDTEEGLPDEEFEPGEEDLELPSEEPEPAAPAPVEAEPVTPAPTPVPEQPV